LRENGVWPLLRTKDAVIQEARFKLLEFAALAHKPTPVSADVGGMKQRLLARALVNDPQFNSSDGPTTGNDLNCHT
jgi:ABC-type transporter Mla maintaining outer membrane lipid asymmetry ATPase subunit MlaF